MLSKDNFPGLPHGPAGNAVFASRGWYRLSVNPWMGRWQGDCMKSQSGPCWIRRLGTEPGNLWWTGSTRSVLRTHGHSDGDASGTAVWGWGAFSGTLARGLKDKEGFSGDCWGDSTYTHRHTHIGFLGCLAPCSCIFFLPGKMFTGSRTGLSKANTNTSHLRWRAAGKVQTTG